MKPTILITLTLLPLTALIVGCSKREEPAPPPPSRPPAVTAPQPAETVKAVTETAPPAVPTATGKYAALLHAFQGAEAGTLANVQKTVAAMEAGKWADALTLLQQLLSGDLTPAQKQAVQDSIAQSQKEVAASTTADPTKAAEDVKKALPFGK